MIPGFKIIDDILKGLPENARLREQLVQLRAELAIFQSENEKLQAKLKDANLEIESLRQQQNPHASVDKRAVDMLVQIANKQDGVALDTLLKYFGFSKPKGDYFFEQLIQHKLVQQLSVKDGVGPIWCATTEGREIAFRRP